MHTMFTKKMMTKSLVVGLVAGLSGGLFVGQASGQLAPPPPKKPTREKVPFVPPPPPRAQPAQIQPPRQTTPTPPSAPEIPYVSLIERDEAGVPIPIAGQIAMAALKHNPLIGEETIRQIRPVVVSWTDNLDLLVIDNIDMVLEVDAGFFETLDMMSEQGVMDAQAYRGALFPRPALLDSYLFSEGVITDAQRKFTGKLIAEYVQQMTISIGEQVEHEWRARIAEENGGEPRELTPEEAVEMRKVFSGKGFAFTFWYLCSDAVWSMHRQLAFASEHLAEILPELDLSEDEHALYMRTMVMLRQTNNVHERRELMVDLITPWEFENQEALLLTALDLRGPLETLAELEDAAIKPDGNAPREDLKDWTPGQPIGPPPGGDG